MTFVDRDGCRWWVIGNASDRSWAPQTDSDGAQVCVDGPKPLPPVALVEEVAPAATPAPTEAPNADEAAIGGFVIQVASFREQGNATAAAANFRSLGLPVSSDGTRLGRNDFYLISLGPFIGSDAAKNALERVKAEGFGDAFIRAR